MAALWLAGGILLIVGGVAGGFALALREQNKWRTAHAFLRLLEYTSDSIRYRGCPAEEVLTAAAAYPEFARLSLERCIRFTEISVPDVFEPAMREELAERLLSLESCGRESACQTLEGMVQLCRPREQSLQEKARSAMRLYPRLGGCIGALAAIALI